MNNAWDAILTHVARRISTAADTTVEPTDIVTPPDPKLGDLAFGCFALVQLRHDDVGATHESPTFKQSPADIAKRLARQLSKDTKDQLVESVSAAGPYLNVTLASGETVARIMSDVEAQQTLFGSSDDGKNRQLMLEYAQPNTHKEFHVGHLRNLVLGNALARILTHAGWNVVTASYHGDVGAHVAKVLWMLTQKVQRPKSKVQSHEQSGKYLGQLYAETTKLLDDHPEWKDEVSEVQRKLEAGDKELTKLWKETRKWSIAEFKDIFDDLGTKIDRQYCESEVVADGQKIVDELLKNGIAKESQGAIIVDLEHEKLGIFLIRKSDGTSLYATKDLALAKLKTKEYPDLARSLILVDNRQSLYCKQL
ncbi:MAG: arginine--tRNA ligase, partial [Patescibacteria group bacterium]